MKAVVIGSDSSGNCVALVGKERTILVDCGVSAKKLCNLLPVYGVDPKSITHVLVTHAHGDHCKGVSKILEMTGAMICAGAATIKSINPPVASIPMDDVESVNETGFRVTSFPVPHDSDETLGFRIQMDGIDIGYVTDSGYITEHMAVMLVGVETLFIEANHDKRMLQEGMNRHPGVKFRVNGYHGHLSNDAARDLIAHLRGSGLKRAILCHLSKDANTPEIALKTVAVKGVDIQVAKAGLVIEF